ncbi:MAG: HEPN domain-containing protein [Ignavibacteria bacterium]|nr:HEPN domain-containing protein [Ignavibacteria bacterium]
MTSEFWNRAQENLKAAEILLDNGLLNAAANRAYYAAYHAAAALIEAKGLEYNSDHRKVQAVFNGEILRRSKNLPGELRGYLATMHDIRAIADYTKKEVSKRMANEQVKKAQYFLSCIAKDLTL